MEILEIKDVKIEVQIEIVRSNRCCAYLRNNHLRLKIPHFLSNKEKEKQVLKFKEWAIKMVLKKPERYKKIIRDYNHGDIFKVGEEEYKLNILIIPKNSSSAKIKENEIILKLSSYLEENEKKKHVSILLSKCIASKRITNLQEKVKELNEKYFKQEINEIKFKNQKSRWGSCSKRKNINISTRLLLAPEEVLEYVCIHELAHLIEFNHSERFWKLVENAMPSYKEKEKWLSNHGNECEF